MAFLEREMLATPWYAILTRLAHLTWQRFNLLERKAPIRLFPFSAGVGICMAIGRSGGWGLRLSSGGTGVHREQQSCKQRKSGPKHNSPHSMYLREMGGGIDFRYVVIQVARDRHPQSSSVHVPFCHKIRKGCGLSRERP